MSQQKVDKYKQEKANRQQIMKKQKMTRIAHILLALVIGVGLVGWFGVSLVRSRLAEREPVPTQIQGAAVENYLTEMDKLLADE